MSKLFKAMERIKHIAECLDDDDPDKVEMLNIEGDYSALMEWSMRKRTESQIHEEGCKQLAAMYGERKARFAKRADNFKDICATLMECAEEEKYEGIAGTASFRKPSLNVVILDEKAIHDDYMAVKKSPDKKAIKSAIEDGIKVEGAELKKSEKTLTIRVK